jgi:hypothetical protein
MLTMTTQLRTYRGVAYDPSQHEQASSTSVPHTYRGLNYEAPLRHEASVQDPKVELHYRGSVYHHHQVKEQRSINS